MKRFLERQPQRFQRTSCFWIRLPHKMKESTVLFLFQITPVLDELVVYADEPQLGDDFVYLMYNAVNLHEFKLRYQQYEERGSRSILTSLPRLQKRLKRLTFRRVFLSVSSFGHFVSAPAEEEDAPEGTQPVFHAKCWLESLEAITFFNMPPSKQTRETSKAVIESLKPLEQTACDLIQGLRTLSSMRLHNPISATTIILDVSDGRLGLEPFDRAAYRAYAQSLPAPPKNEAKGKRRVQWVDDDFWDGKTYTNQVPEGFVFEVPSAVWAGAGSSRAAGSSDPSQPLEPKNAKGRCVLIPHSMWPDYKCTENGGAGWSAVIKTCTAGGIAKVQFDTATDDEGRPYPDEHVRLSDLRPLP